LLVLKVVLPLVLSGYNGPTGLVQLYPAGINHLLDCDRGYRLALRRPVTYGELNRMGRFAAGPAGCPGDSTSMIANRPLGSFTMSNIKTLQSLAHQ
jgi:hypothetical protein